MRDPATFTVSERSLAMYWRCHNSGRDHRQSMPVGNVWRVVRAARHIAERDADQTFTSAQVISYAAVPSYQGYLVLSWLLSVGAARRLAKGLYALAADHVRITALAWYGTDADDLGDAWLDPATGQPVATLV